MTVATSLEKIVAIIADADAAAMWLGASNSPYPPLVMPPEEARKLIEKEPARCTLRYWYQLDPLDIVAEAAARLATEAEEFLATKARVTDWYAMRNKQAQRADQDA
jgi:hypothetical protein